jgi:hypothetical protein
VVGSETRLAFLVSQNVENLLTVLAMCQLLKKDFIPLSYLVN